MYVRNRWRDELRPKVNMLRNGVFMFDFESMEAKMSILSGKWTYQGCPLILRPWSPEFDPDNIDVGKVPVWLLFPDLPYILWNADALGKITSYLSNPLATDRLTAEKDRLAYARVLIDIEIKKK